MNKKKIEAILFSTVGVAAMLLILVAVNFIGSLCKQRIDLTKEKLYTLSAGTKAILGKLDGTVEVRFYCTQGENEMPAMLKNYARRVEDLLSEYKQIAKGKLEIKKLDPKPDSDAEDSANLDGVEGQLLSNTEKLYLGVAISFLDKKVALPFLSPEREKLLEYDISRAISSVMTAEKAVIGVMTSLPVFGQPPNPMMMRMGQMKGQEPWAFITELQRDFTVEQVDPSVDQIDEKYKVLMLLHPKDLSDKAQYALDQFVLRGGKLVVFMDPLALMDSSNSNQMLGNMSAGSSLDKLLKAWGVEFENAKVVADMNYKTQLRTGQGGRVQEVPSFLSLTKLAINQEDVLTSQLDNLHLPFPGVFSGTPAAGLTKTVLLHTSENAQLVDKMMAQMASEQIIKEFKSANKEYALAIRLTGKFKTAFPDGKPKDAPAADDKKDEKDADKKKDDKAETSLKESKNANAVTLVADTDFLFDQFAVQVQEFFGQRIMIPRNGNLNLVQNLVEQLAGDENLIGVRSRATQNRPFTVVNKMQADAEARYQSKIKKLEDDLAETQRRLNELQRNKDKNQRFILSPEQQAELANFRKKEAEVSKELKGERKKLRKDIDSLENRLKVINIAGMPLFVSLTGVALAFFKRKRTAAK